jgi:hypothetical protein
MSEHNIPFQIKDLIDSLGNKKENVYLRGNYRLRLDEIKRAIEKSIRAYDDEVYASNRNTRTGKIRTYHAAEKT